MFFSGKKSKIKTHILIPLNLLIAAALYLAASHIPGFADAYCRNVFRPLSDHITPITGAVPLSLTELLAILLVLLFIAALWRRGLLAALYHLAKIASVLLVLYMAFCGVNYHKTSFALDTGLQTMHYGKTELIELCEHLASMTNASAAALPENALFAAGQEFVQEKEVHANGTSLQKLNSIAAGSMQHLGQFIPQLAGHYPHPKALLISHGMTLANLTGIYLPFFIEANYNKEIPYYNLPFTACHELAHLRGYMQEEEANYIAYLACRESEDPYFRYSGYLEAFVYAGNSLAKIDRESYAKIYQKLNADARRDLDYNNRFWDRYDGKIAEAENKLNDSYLKANGQTEGVQSYGMVTDLILSDFMASKITSAAKADP